ncbi:MAG: hypothetical protein P1V97_04160, partial [Planctomycetota bacterium]|nr:hypothetical protein [Planctomycetota bacterium]
MRTLTLAILSFALLSNVAFAEDTLKIKGHWKVNVEKSIEAMKKTPKGKNMSETEAKQAKSMLTGFAKVMELIVDDKKVTFKMGARAQAADYTVKSATAKKVVLECTMKRGDKEMKQTMTFTMDGKCL